MKIAVLGTGMVGKTIASKMISLGHEVKMGSRTNTNEKASEWVKASGSKASQGTFAEAVTNADFIFNCTLGMASIDALTQAGAANLKGKIMIDLANALDFSKGMPPSLAVCNTDSLGEQIQKAFPDLKVVKTLNTMNCKLMMDPTLVPGDHDLFMSGNDAGAKATVSAFLKKELGWKNIIDLGDIRTSRGTEMLLPVWLNLWGVFGNPNFNFKIVK
jgi:predicted dinucleotide-binding enzyme